MISLGNEFMIRNVIIFIVSFLCIECISMAQNDPAIQATVDRQKLPLNESAILTVEITGINADQPELPDIKGLTVYPSGQSQNITIINGQMSSTAVYRYTIQPQGEGSFTIPSIELKHNDKIYKTDPIQMQVIKAGVIETRGPTSEAFVQGQDQQSEENLLPVFCKSSVDKKKVYVGEQMVYIFKFYRKINLLDQPQYQAPKFTHFWVEELPPEKLYYEIIQGVKYVVSEISVALFPTTSGKFTIEPAKIRCVIPDANKRRDPFSIFDEDPFQFFGSDPFQSSRELILSSNAMDIEVIDLPKKDQPKSFAGAVGVYELHSAIDKKEAVKDEPLTLTVALNGKGNIQSLTEPKLEKSDLFKIYDSGYSDDIKKDNGIVQGKKEFKKVLIPVQLGSIEVPEISFSFFDPQKGLYKTVKTNSILLQVKRGEHSITDVPEEIESEKAVIQPLHKDIRFIKTNYRSFQDYSKWPSISLLFYSLMIPFGFFIFSMMNDIRNRFAKNNLQSIEAKKALKNALHKLSKLDKSSAIDPIVFYNELEKILNEFIAKKLGISAQGYKWDDVVLLFQKSNLDSEIISKLKSFRDQVYFERYAISQMNSSKKLEMIKHLQKMILQMDKTL